MRVSSTSSRSVSAASTNASFVIFFTVLLLLYGLGVAYFLIFSRSGWSSPLSPHATDEFHLCNSLRTFDFAADLAKHDHQMHSRYNNRDDQHKYDLNDKNNDDYNHQSLANAEPVPHDIVNPPNLRDSNSIRSNNSNSNSRSNWSSGSSVHEPKQLAAPWELSIINGIQQDSGVFDVNEKLLSVLVWHAHFQEQTSKAKQGDSMGELVYWRNVLQALANLHVKVLFLTSPDALREALLGPGSKKDKFDIILTDGYSLKPFEDTGLIKDAWFKCRLRILDDWGTPPAQNHLGLHLHQYLIPFTCTASSTTSNFLLGHYIPMPNTSSPIRKSHQLVVWGKESRYYQRYTRLLERIQSILPVYVMAKPETNQYLPSGVTNLGIKSQSEREGMLLKSKILLGLGDPVLGITPFEALSRGCVYINPMYRELRSYWMNSECALSSQHPETEKIGLPRVHNVYLDDSDKVVEAVRQALAWSDEQSNERGGVDPFIPDDFRFVNFVRRLDKSLRTDYCANT